MNEHCIEWSGARTPDGYGSIFRRGYPRYAHHWAYEKFYGPIPAGLSVLHSCDNPPCINPFHLRAGSQSDNILDSVQRGHHFNANKTHCPRGHEYTAANTRGGGRQGRKCRTCDRERIVV